MKVLKIEEIVQGILDGNRRAVSRGISVVENDYDTAAARRIIREIFPHTGHAQIVGITGPPGIGKSTMIGNLSATLSKKGFRASVSQAAHVYAVLRERFLHPYPVTQQ